MDRIESTQNPRVKAAKALQTVKGRNESGMFLCEGEHMVQEAVRAADTTGAVSAAFALGSAFAVDTLFVDEACEEKYAELVAEARADYAFVVPAHVLAAISTVKSPQGIAAIVRLQVPQITAREDLGVPGVSPAAFGIAAGRDDWEDAGEAEQAPDGVDGGAGYDIDSEAGYETDDEADDDIPPSVLGDRLVLLEAVQDPGNVGAILRTMDAAGFTGAILGPGCADPFSPKALRATMGSIFRVPTLQVADAARAAEALAREGYAVIAAALDGEDFFLRKPLAEKVCLIIGNEGAGITNQTLAAATHRYRLPMRGGAESLNAAAAAAIMIYDIAYRR